MSIYSAGQYQPSVSNAQTDISLRRGVDHLDAGYDVILAKANYSDVVKAVIDLVEAKMDDLIAYGQEAPNEPSCLIVYRFRGQTWTIIDSLRNRKWQILQPQFAKEISRRCNAKSLHYTYNDSVVGYSLYDKGEVSERFLCLSPDELFILDSYSDQNIKESDFFTIDADVSDLDELEIEELCQPPFYAFPYTLKEKLKTPEIADFFIEKKCNFPAKFVDVHLRSQDLFIPAISWGVATKKYVTILSVEGLKPTDFDHFSCIPYFKNIS